MHNVKSVVISALTLTLICAVVVAALAGTNMLTKGPIEENARRASEETCKEVLPAAASFETMEGPWSEGVESVYKGLDADGNVVGYVVQTSTKGKSKDLVLMTAVGVDGGVSRVKVVSESETAGYVDKVEKAGLFETLIGANAQTDMAQLDGVAGATKTSNGVKDGVALAVQTVKEVLARG